MAVYVGKDVGKLKAKSGGKWKYMSEKDMLDFSAPFAPYRYDECIVSFTSLEVAHADCVKSGVCSRGTCGALQMSTSRPWRRLDED